MINSKKLEELSWLKRFRAKAGMKFEVLDNDRERPDFLINVDGRCVGVEVTEIHIDQSQIDSSGGSAYHRSHSIEDEIITCAQSEYTNTSSRSILAKFEFKSNNFSQKFDKNAMAKSIVDVLHELDLRDMGKCKINRQSTPVAPPFVNVIYVRGLPADIQSPWQLINTGWAKNLQPCDVEPILAKKNQRINDYRNTVCENWLLIYANGWWPHGRFSLPLKGEYEWPNSKFERTYVFCEPDRFLIRLGERGWINEINASITSNYSDGF